MVSTFHTHVDSHGVCNCSSEAFCRFTLSDLKFKDHPAVQELANILKSSNTSSKLFSILHTQVVSPISRNWSMKEFSLETNYLKQCICCIPTRFILIAACICRNLKRKLIPQVASLTRHFVAGDHDNDILISGSGVISEDKCHNNSEISDLTEVEIENQSKYASERLVAHFTCVHGCILGTQIKALMFIGMPTIQGESSDKAQLAIRPLILAVAKVLESMALEVAMLFGVIEKIPTEQETLPLSEQVCVFIYWRRFRIHLVAEEISFGNLFFFSLDIFRASYISYTFLGKARLRYDSSSTGKGGESRDEVIFWGEWMCWVSNCCSRCRSSLQQRGQLTDDDEINSFYSAFTISFRNNNRFRCLSRLDEKEC